VRTRNEAFDSTLQNSCNGANFAEVSVVFEDSLWGIVILVRKYCFNEVDVELTKGKLDTGIKGKKMKIRRNGEWQFNAKSYETVSS
jgi:hypothetical protein